MPDLGLADILAEHVPHLAACSTAAEKLAVTEQIHDLALRWEPGPEDVAALEAYGSTVRALMVVMLAGVLAEAVGDEDTDPSVRIGVGK
jgi:hypothetical protein